MNFLYKIFQFNTLLFSFILFTSILSSQNVIPKQESQITHDHLSPGKANPGDIIRYKVRIENTGMDTAKGVQLNVIPDPLTSFISGSFRTSPLAFDDMYSCSGNVGISIPAGTGVFLNDFDDNPGGLTALEVMNAMTTAGGSISISPDGSFTYSPPGGFTGMDTYEYTLIDGNPVGVPVPNSDMGTIRIMVENMIWFVDNTGGGSGGTGTLTDPFKTLGDFNTSLGPQDGHLVFIRHTGTNYGGGIVLKNNMTLIGTGHTGGTNLSDVLPFTLAPNSQNLPAINGSRPVIVNAAGNGVTLASGNTLRGFDLGNCSGFGIDDNGGVGMLNISELLINNTTGGGFRTDNGGTLAVTMGSLTATGGVNALHLSGTSGVFTITGALMASGQTGDAVHLTNISTAVTTGAATIVATAANQAIEIQNNTGSISFGMGSAVSGSSAEEVLIHQGNGNVTFNGSVTGTTGGTIKVTGRTGGTVDFQGSINHAAGATGIVLGTATAGENNSGGTIQFTGNTKNINSGASTAVSIVNNTGATIQFTNGGLNVDATSGTAFSVIGGGTVNVSGASNTIDATSGTAFLNSGTGGSATININAAISNTTGRLIDIQNRAQNNNVTLSGNLSNSGTGILVNSNSMGTILLSGSVKSLTTGASNGVTLSSNSGATINFTGGGLEITTTTGTGFTATNGGTVSVQGSGNTINSSSGATALNVVSTGIGASNLNFQSISSNGGSSTGIILDNTGTSGGLIVNGDGTNTTLGGNSSGGTITGKTGANLSTTTGIGIYLNNTRNVVLRRMTFNGTKENFAIRGNSVVNFTMEYCTVTGSNGNSADHDEGSVRFENLTGSASILACNISGGFEDNIRIVNNSGTLNRITIDNTTIGANSIDNGNDGIIIEGSNSATVNVTVQNSTFTSSRADLIQVSMIENANSDFVFTGNICSNNHPAISTGGGGVTIGNDAGNMTVTMSNNSFRDAVGTAILMVNGTNLGSGNLTATLSNNTIGVAATTNSGSLEGDGIKIQHAGGGGILTALVQNNQVRQYNNQGIHFQAGAGLATGGNFNITVTGNTVSNPGTNMSIGGVFQGIHLNNGVTPLDNFLTCIHIGANVITGSGRNGGTDFRVRQRQSTTVRLPGYGGGTTDTGAVVAFIQGNLVTVATGSAVAESPPGGGFVGGVACNTP